MELKKQNKGERLPYRLMSSFDLKAVEDHFQKYQIKREFMKAAITIQSYFRMHKAKKYYERFKHAKLQLAVKVQRAWRRYHMIFKVQRQEEMSKLKKVVLIQSWFRGIITRK